ncbi:MAG: hypothetical protein JWL81_51 [Verrucomicrobiales bacterium]|nr:hypothetical protein [Verrucomicrobiales bacterium]
MIDLLEILLAGTPYAGQSRACRDAESAANAVSLIAKNTRTVIDRLAQTVEKRIQEVERENAAPSLLTVRLLEHLSEADPAAAKRIAGEVAEALRTATPDSTAVLAQAIDLPAGSHTPIRDYKKPPVVGPRPTPRPIAIPAKPKP